MELPFRQKLQTRIPGKSAAGRRQSSDIRNLVRNADNCKLTIDPVAFEVLSTLGGKQLTPSIRGVLLNTLEEYLGGAAGMEAGDQGPLGLGDVLGAILGIAHFAVENPNPWLFVRIPEGSEKSADVFALPAGTRDPWHLELKAVAPLSAEVPYRSVLDTCGGRISGQCNKGFDQLEGDLAAPQGLAPAVAVAGTALPTARVAPGGKALSVVVLPDGMLARRTDILPVVNSKGAPTKGCPPNQPCPKLCFDGAFAGSPVAMVGLLWQEPNPVALAAPNGTNISPPPSAPLNIRPAGPPSPDPNRGAVPPAGPPAGPTGGPDPSPWPRVLTAVYALQAANWSDSNAAADAALTALADRLAEAIEAGDDESRGPLDVLLRALRGSRQVTSQEVRLQAIGRVPGTRDRYAEEFTRESQRGLATPRRVVSVENHRLYSELDEGSEGADDEEVIITWEGYTGSGRFRAGELRVSPHVEMLDRGRTLDAEAGYWLEAATRALTRSILPWLFGMPVGTSFDRFATLDPAQVRLTGQGEDPAPRVWTVASECRYRFPWGAATLRLPPTGVPTTLRERINRVFAQATNSARTAVAQSRGEAGLRHWFDHVEDGIFAAAAILRDEGYSEIAGIWEDHAYRMHYLGPVQHFIPRGNGAWAGYDGRIAASLPFHFSFAH